MQHFTGMAIAAHLSWRPRQVESITDSAIVHTILFNFRSQVAIFVSLLGGRRNEVGYLKVESTVLFVLFFCPCMMH